MTRAPATTGGMPARAPTPPPASVAAPAFLRRLPSPIGRIEITSDGHSVTSLAIARDGQLPRDAMPERTSDVLEHAAAQLDEYFAGVRRDFDLPVHLVGTDFQHAVWAELEKLKWGEISSYGRIGLATGRVAAGRAVGGAIGANPVPIIVGCHRVLAASRKITGYSGGNGVPTKAWLLDHEGIPHG